MFMERCQISSRTIFDKKSKVMKMKNLIWFPIIFKRVRQISIGGNA